MPKLPVVSVIIPTRNRPSLTRRALESVEKQSFRDLEIIIVDDCSDASSAFAASQSDLPMKVITNESVLGAQQSRLVGVETATGMYVALLDSDDWWSPDKLQKQIEVSRQHPNALISCRATVRKGSLLKIAPRRILQKGERVEDFLYRRSGMIQTSTMMASRRNIHLLLAESASLTVHNDTAILLCAQRQGIPIIQMNEPLSNFDDNKRRDRISYDPSRINAALDWYKIESKAWSTW